MQIQAEVILKSPALCGAWVESWQPWEVPSEDKKTVEFWKTHHLAVEKGYEPPEKYLQPYLYWEPAIKATTISKKLPADIHKRIFSLAEAALTENEKAFQDALIAFCKTYGPLVNSTCNIVSLFELKNALGFFYMVADLWDGIFKGRDYKIRRYFLRPFEDGYSDPRRKEVEEFVQAFTGEPKSYRLYMEGKTPVLYSEYGHRIHDMGAYYLEIPSKADSIPQGGQELLSFAQNVLDSNIKRYLKSLVNFTTPDVLKGLFVISPPDVITAALFSFFIQEMGKKPFNRAEYQRQRRQEGLTVKDEALSLYRRWKNRGKITSEEYEKLRGYADTLYESGIREKDELRKRLNNFLMREVFKNGGTH